MKKYLILIFLAILTNTIVYSQSKLDIDKINSMADNLYALKEYDQAAKYYIQLIDLSEFKQKKANVAYNASCCLALQNKKDSAFILLNKSIELGFSDKSSVINDKDLIFLHDSEQWAITLEKMQNEKILNSDPNKAQFITDDIHRFWKAFDIAQKDTLNAYNIYKKYYFDKASIGMADYMSLKVNSINQFTNHIETHPKLYSSIRQNSFQVDNFKKDFLKSFQNLKEIYPGAKFPNVYFVIGAFTSGGTVSDAGLLIGVNQMCKDDNTNLEELNFIQQFMLSKLEILPHVVAHELIHFQQDEIVKDTITLGYAINEGMADFICELISGKSANPHLLEWVKGKEKRVWSKFKVDMYFNRYDNWIANYNSFIANYNESPEDSFPDLGYWIGYEICKSYYENSPNKKNAIYEMLHIKNYRQFLVESRWEEKLSRME